MKSLAKPVYGDVAARSSREFSQAQRTNPGNGKDGLLRARELLQMGGDLTIEQFFELDGLFRDLGQAQFAALTKDPLHQVALRRYEALSWRQGNPTMIVTSLLSLIAVAAATLLTLPP